MPVGVDYVAPSTGVVKEGDMWSGIHTSGVIPDSYVNHGEDNLGTMAFITRGHTKFLHMLNSKFTGAQRSIGKNRFYMTHELTELDRTFRVKKAQGVAYKGTATTFNEIVISSEQAAQLQPNDILISRNKYVKYEGSDTAPTYSLGFGDAGIQTNGTATGVFAIDQEQMFVRSIDRDPDSDGNCKITVYRNYRGHGMLDSSGAYWKGTVDMTTYPAAQYLENDLLLRALPTFPEGSGAPDGYGKVPVKRGNWVQEFKYAVSVTKEQQLIKTYLGTGNSTMELYKMLKLRQASCDIERTFLFSQRGLEHDSSGRLISTTGGVIEHILRDSDHIHNYLELCGVGYTAGTPQTDLTALKWDKWHDLGMVIAADGGSENRTLYCGLSLYTELKKAWNNESIIRIDPGDVDMYDIPVEHIITAGLKMNIIPLYTMEEFGWGNKALVVDNGYPSFSPVKVEGYDMKVSDISPIDVEIKKEQWIGMYGVEAKHLQYQHIIDFDNASPGLATINKYIY